MYTRSDSRKDFLVLDLNEDVLDCLVILTTDESLKNHLQLTFSGPEDVDLAKPVCVLTLTLPARLHPKQLPSSVVGVNPVLDPKITNSLNKVFLFFHKFKER